jgi:hypothetical protein
MKHLGLFLRAVSKLRFWMLGLATIKDISGDKFKNLVSGLQRQGWRPCSRYSGFDAGIDYDCFRLRKGLSTLTCEWDNWTEWSVEGRRPIIEAVARENQLKVTYAWRWSEL